MNTDISSPNTERSSAKWPWSTRIFVAILALVLATILFLQIVRPVDNGTSNGFTFIAVFLGIVTTGVWLALFAPFERRTRWLGVAGMLAFGLLMCQIARLDGFDGNLRPIVHWRWSRDAEKELLAKGIDKAANAEPVKWFTTPHDFAGFLGSNRDAYVPDVHLNTDWTASPPKLLWKQPIGGGYSGFAIVGDAAITLEQRGEEELVTCYDLETGRLRWFHAIKARHHDLVGGDGPGSTPTVHEGRVYALGGTGVLRCLDGATGKEIWIRDVLADVGTNAEADHTPVPWGRSASPLIVDDLCVVPGGGPAADKTSLVAYNRLDGKIVWKAGKSEVSYSSPSMANYGGVRQIVSVNEATLTGHDPTTGEVLWEAPWEGASGSTATASQSIQVADDRLFISKGYSVGGAGLFEIKKSDDGTFAKPKKLWHNHRVLMTKLNNVVVKDGFAYGLSDGVLQCVDVQNGKKRWAGDDYGHGQVLRIGDTLLVTGEDGVVALVAFDPEAFHELAKLQALNGKTWNNPAISGNRLLVRNAEEAACFEVPLVADASEKLE